MTISPNFTPGPWGKKINGDTCTISKDDRLVCQIPFYGYLKQDTYDSYLILAAPELYMALEEEISHLTVIKNNVSENIKETLRIRIRAIKNILKKARGEE